MALRYVKPLDEKLDRFAMLRDTITGLEADKSALGDDIKAAMLQGRKPETGLYRARLQTTRKVTYPVERFREVYGDAATFEVVLIDSKKVKQLVQAGDLDGQPLEGLGEVREVHALCLVTKDL